MPKTIIISFKELEKLKNYILASGIKRVTTSNEYELLRIRDGEANLIVYKSGKVVYENNEATRKIIDAIMVEEREHYTYILGSDETGKGEWYGPLVVVCTALTPQQIKNFRKMGVRDSKTIGKKELFQLEQKVLKENFPKQISYLLPETYNKMYKDFRKENKNLNDLLAWAHSAAIKTVLDLIKYEKVKIVIDKFDVEKTYRRLYTINDSKAKIIQKSRGETEIPVALASILAKVRFENLVDSLDGKYNLNLRNSKPEDIPVEVLPHVAKLHFKNVKKAIEEKRS